MTCGERNALALAVLCERAFFPLLRVNSTNEQNKLTWAWQRRDRALRRVCRLLHSHLVVVVHNMLCVALVLLALLFGASALLCSLLLVHLHFVALLRLCVCHFSSEKLLLQSFLVLPLLFVPFTLTANLLGFAFFSKKFFLPPLRLWAFWYFCSTSSHSVSLRLEIFWLVGLVTIASPFLLNIVFLSTRYLCLFRRLSCTRKLMRGRFLALPNNSIEFIQDRLLLFSLP